MKLSIIIVFYENLDDLLNCLKSIYENELKTSFEVIVVDNSRYGVEQKLEKKFEQVKYIKSPGNIGYGAGNNLGAKNAESDYLFILNPDAQVLSNTIYTLISFLEDNPKVGIVAPAMIDRDGHLRSNQGSRKLTPLRGIFTLTFLNKIFPDNPVSNDYWLKDVRNTTERDVEVVPGSAFMIRKNLFDKVGGFDENFFLYFEESDLCKRVKDLGWRIVMTTKAKTVHEWTSHKETPQRKEAFIKSRFYYFRKHYGYLSALLVEASARFSKWNAALLGALGLAAFLRLYMIKWLMEFSGDLGFYFLQARGLIIKGEIPLVGIPSSVPVLKQGALWSWVLAPLIWLGGFNPVFGGYLSAAFGVASVYLIFKLVSEWYGRLTGTIAGLFSATMPFLVITDRVPFVLAPAFTFIILTTYFFDKALTDGGKSFFYTGLFLSITLQFLLGAFIIFPIYVATLIIKRAKIKPKEILTFISGTFIGLLPFYIYDVQRQTFIQTIGFSTWFFTKPFELLFVESTRADGIALNLVQRAVGIIGFPLSTPIAVIVFGTALFLFAKKVFIEKKEMGTGSILVLVWLFTALSSFALRGIFSYAFLPTIALPIIVIVSYAFSYIIEKHKIIGVLALSTYIFANTYFLFRKNFSFSENSHLSLSELTKVAEYITTTSGEMGIKLRYAGPGDHFPSGDNHLRYLLWWMGKEPIDSGELEYFVYTEDIELNYSFKGTKDFGYYKVGVLDDKKIP